MSQSPFTSTTSPTAQGFSEADQGNAIDSLIATYRELNLKVRPVPEAQLARDSAGTSIKHLLLTLRDDELTFAQTLKARLTGVAPEAVDGESAPIVGHEAEENTTAMLISQFGTARATTLSLLKGLTPEAWNQPLDDGEPLYQHVRAIVARDTKVLDQISSLMKQA